MRIRLQRWAMYAAAAVLLFGLAIATPIRRLLADPIAEPAAMDRPAAEDRPVADRNADQPAVPLGDGQAVRLSDDYAEAAKPASIRSLFSWRGLSRAVLLGLICWLLAVIMITTVQRKLVFVGQTAFRNVDLSIQSTHWDPRRLREVQIATHDGLTLNGWLALAEPSSLDNTAAIAQSDRPLVVYFGGNAGTRKMRLYSFGQLTDIGCDVLIVDYRSFADNPGRPSETAFLADARTIVDYAREDLGCPIERLVLCGESLGGGVATATAANLCEDGLVPGGLLLRSTFASLTETAGYHYPFLPVSMLLIDRFESDARIAAVRCPILQLHGDEDVVVPIEHGRRLHGLAPAQSDSGVAKRFVELPGAGHNNVLRTSAGRVREQIADWLQAIELMK